jgi:hypothetical protein
VVYGGWGKEELRAKITASSRPLRPFSFLNLQARSIFVCIYLFYGRAGFEETYPLTMLNEALFHDTVRN